MNINLKPIELDDGQEYCDLLIELARYEDVFARPVPSDFEESEFQSFKVARVKMATGIDLKETVPRTSTYWVMDDDTPIGYATLKHKPDLTKPGGHFGCCLKKEYQGLGVGTIVANHLSKIAYEDLGIEEVIFTSKSENEQSKRSVEKIGGTLIKVENGYHFYTVNIKEKIESMNKGKNK